MNETTDSDIEQFVDRYIALWNQPDPDIRRKLIRELWAPDGGQVLVDPPMEVREAAQQLNFPIPPLEVRGYDVLEARVTRAYEMFIASGEYEFTLAAGPMELLKNVVTITWAMTSRANGEVAGMGSTCSASTGTAASAPATSSSRADPGRQSQPGAGACTVRGAPPGRR